MSFARRLVDPMPEIVKLTVVGIAIAPPTVRPTENDPTYVMALNHLVALGIAVATIAGDARTYHLTRLGLEARDLIEGQTCTL